MHEFMNLSPRRTKSLPDCTGSGNDRSHVSRVTVEGPHRRCPTSQKSKSLNMKNQKVQKVFFGWQKSQIYGERFGLRVFSSNCA